VAWVKWETICKSKESGGLRNKNLSCFNKALLSKWKWRLGKDIMSKYESWKSLDSNIDKPPGSIWWRDLRSICGKRNNGNWFIANIKGLVGNGSDISFWENLWIRENPLRSMYPRQLQIFQIK